MKYAFGKQNIKVSLNVSQCPIWEGGDFFQKCSNLDLGMLKTLGVYANFSKMSEFEIVHMNFKNV